VSTPVTLRGRLTRDPELTYARSGTAVARFSVVTSRNFKNRETGAWEEKDTSFWNVVAFGQLAEGCAESLEKGTLVLVQGNAAEDRWEDKEGNPRRAVKVTADDVAPSLRFASAQVKRTERERPTESRPPADDPWAADAPAQDDLPPF
jgi:single-strand DNA-binding protein